MQNPFPGIDPFVEAEGDWPDFHATFMGAWREAISRLLPRNYVAKIEERMTVIEDQEDLPRQPSAKSGEGRSQYLARRHEVLSSDAHLVELDLLIGGKPLPFDKPLKPTHFHSSISRAGRRPGCEVYSWSLDEPMPPLPVPLAQPDPDIVVDLAKVLVTTYERGEYWKTIDYQSPINLDLSDEYRGWIQQRVSASTA
jgi:hypothetical protein